MTIQKWFNCIFQVNEKHCTTQFFELQIFSFLCQRSNNERNYRYHEIPELRSIVHGKSNSFSILFQSANNLLNGFLFPQLCLIGLTKIFLMPFISFIELQSRELDIRIISADIFEMEFFELVIILAVSHFEITVLNFHPKQNHRNWSETKLSKLKKITRLR